MSASSVFDICNLSIRLNIIPPSVSRSTPSAVEIREGHNVTLTCKAEGNPIPSVIWRRKDRQIIRYNGATGFGASVFHGPGLQLTKVNRKHMSEYICVASNGIPPDESWAVKLLVTYQYATTQTVSGQYHSVHILEIKRVEPHHYGSYRCIARNDNGIHHARIQLEEAEASYLYTNAIQEGSGLVSDDEDSDRELTTRDKSERSKEFGRRRESTSYPSLAQPQSTTVTEAPYAGMYIVGKLLTCRPDTSTVRSLVIASCITK
uniref:Ig-like domain-containing protein n=1 Tax=Heterorhabditis bacteriophora TaxID=37862 RepID=A0A1I7W6H5_HETBA